jgi:hypothetical protein
MRISFAFLLTFLLIFTPFAHCSERCDWTSGDYDQSKYIRVIRQPTERQSLHYLCWERAKVQSVIFRNTEACSLAIQFRDGIRCVMCFENYVLEGGRCIKSE